MNTQSEFKRYIPDLHALNWHADGIDSEGRVILGATSIYHTDGDYFTFRFRVESNWTCTEMSDAELISGAPRTWPSIGAAKAAILADHIAMIESIDGEVP